MSTPADELRAAASTLRTDLPHNGEAQAIATLLDTEAASNAGDEDHTHCTADSCTLVAALAVARLINAQP